jgi:hypothetical protein
MRNVRGGPIRASLITALLITATACPENGTGPVLYTIAAAGGTGQSGGVGTTLPQPLTVLVTDTAGAPAAGVAVLWSVAIGNGSITPDTALTDAQGHASATHTLGTGVGAQVASAAVPGAAGSPVTFTATALAGAAAQLAKASGDGQAGPPGAILGAPLAVRVRDQYGNALAGDSVTWTVTSGGGSLSAPVTVSDGAGLATVHYTLGDSAGVNTVTAAVTGVLPVTFTATAVAQAVLVAQVPIPPYYGIHDTFVRDGLAFVCAWDSGVIIFDVGHGVAGGSPVTPQRVAKVVTTGGNVHNAWWFHDSTGAKKYLFVGQEGPGGIGSSSSGDIHVVDVSNLAAPTEVAFFHLTGAGPHNFWMDEAAQRLYAAYYNGGVVTLDVSGTLTGDLSSRGIDTIAPGGAGNTYVWSVQRHNGSVYAIDMLSGLWQLSDAAGALGVAGGGNNVPERYGSDVWLQGAYAYSGTWGLRAELGNAVKVWQLNGTGAPVLVDSIITAGIGTVSDVEVTSDGKLLMFSAENGPNAGFYFYSLADPAHPAFLSRYLVSTGVHTATFGYINSRVYAFGAKDPGSPALVILDVTALVP